ncbi:uncharacterized protein LOC124207881 [Daphnia pulex]|uniref:uncharacterized protein LOC124207881 n=1 Tax=Daphnia pulex TaxID=6669 RepID=UPI001EDE0CB2|nr:uncharacterized protein LOC124207881 [Daphnia pulex]
MNNLWNKFCCCSLQTGAKLVGTFSLFSGIAGFIKAVMTLSSGKSNDDNMDDSSTEDTTDTGTPLYSILLIISSLITIFVSILVVIAAWKNRKHRFLLPWLILNPLSALTGIGFTFYSAILHWIEQEIAMGIGYAAASVIIAGSLL